MQQKHQRRAVPPSMTPTLSSKPSIRTTTKLEQQNQSSPYYQSIEERMCGSFCFPRSFWRSSFGVLPTFRVHHNIFHYADMSRLSLRLRHLPRILFLATTLRRRAQHRHYRNLRHGTHVPFRTPGLRYAGMVPSVEEALHHDWTDHHVFVAGLE